MKHITLYAATGLLVISVASHAETIEKLNIERATVFLSGAQVESSAKVHFNKGENEIRFTNVAGNVNNQSIVVGAGNGVVVESVTFQNNYLVNDNISPRAKELKDSIELLTNQKQPLNTRVAVLNEQLAILQSNHKVGGDNTGLSITELQKLLDLVNVKMESYINDKAKNELALRKLDEHITRLNQQLNEEQAKGYQPGGVLLVKFYAKDASNNAVNISYNITNAGWTPTYDVWADDSKSPLKFFYKANVFQNSGIKWDNVKLSLSTGNPQQGMQAPTLNPWYLAFYQQQQIYRRKMAKSNAEYAAPAAVSGGAYRAEASEDASTMDEYVTVDNSGINTSFDIELPYTIPSDGQNHLVAIKKYEVPATFEYFAAPKADKDAFLQAKITHWEDFNMLPGTTNIFYEGTYIGQATVNPGNLMDTMSISLGRDKKIVVKKELDKKLRSVRTIGTNVSETFAYNITVRNTRKEPITITLNDQMPVSNDKDIVIEDKETSKADYNESTGLLVWKLTLKPNETQTIPFGYTIKYPRGKKVSGL